jgi:hypothetical protein
MAARKRAAEIQMVKHLFACVVLVLSFAFVQTTRAQDAQPVPDEYVGDWVCQTFTPGYNIVPPHADLSQPQTNRATTPATVQILKFSVRADGTYSTPNATGRYSFNQATGAVTWIDGPHQSTLTQTQLGKCDNGAPKMEFLSGKRRYGCFSTRRR